LARCSIHGAPRRDGRILADAIPETLIANCGMLLLTREGRGGREEGNTESAWPEASASWMMAAACVAVFYVFGLGRGIGIEL